MSGLISPQIGASARPSLARVVHFTTFGIACVAVAALIIVILDYLRSVTIASDIEDFSCEQQLMDCPTCAVSQPRSAGDYGPCWLPHAPVDGMPSLKDNLLVLNAIEQAENYIVQSAVSAGASSLVWGVVYNNEILYTNGFSWEGYEGETPDAQTLYRIGSLTKTMTACLAFHLWEHGYLNLTAPISSFNPDFGLAANPFGPSADPVTALNLVSHTSGLPTGSLCSMTTTGGCDISNADAFQLFKDHISTTTTPRRQPTYSNLGFALLGRALEEPGPLYAGKTFEDVIMENLAPGLNMTHIYFDFADVQTSGLAYADVSFALGPDAPGTNDIGWMNPAGGAWSNVENMLRYLGAFMNKEDESWISAETREAVAAPIQAFWDDADLQAAGWVKTRRNGVWQLDKNGDLSPYHANARLEPESRIGIVTLITEGEHYTGASLGDLDGYAMELLLPALSALAGQYETEPVPVPNYARYLGCFNAAAVVGTPICIEASDIDGDSAILTLNAPYVYPTAPRLEPLGDGTFDGALRVVSPFDGVSSCYQWENSGSSIDVVLCNFNNDGNIQQLTLGSYLEEWFNVMP
eukprot:gnl/Chilomastix_cuspidata/2114.p1 GENE.gnl/Chilomastix_cuspidata/2114~~gnl/Chilomastix_cuspidata/2114.p1  ORF type:complete len:580 (+),score=135.99 gnl/Chilomastix_cuspidata/2114:252-1991(+)